MLSWLAVKMVLGARKQAWVSPNAFSSIRHDQSSLKFYCVETFGDDLIIWAVKIFKVWSAEFNMEDSMVRSHIGDTFIMVISD